jgi:hypothetical protein
MHADQCDPSPLLTAKADVLFARGNARPKIKMKMFFMRVSFVHWWWSMVPALGAGAEFPFHCR